MGKVISTNNVEDPASAIEAPFHLYRQLAEIAVLLETDYFHRLTLQGLLLRVEVVVSHIDIQQLVF